MSAAPVISILRPPSRVRPIPLPACVACADNGSRVERVAVPGTDLEVLTTVRCACSAGRPDQSRRIA